MKTSNRGIELIKKYEGLRTSAYRCPAGVYTIGYGHTKNVKEGDTISIAEAERLLKEDLVKYENNVNKYNSIYQFKQNEFDALVSFAFNIGSIDQLVQKGKRTKKEIASKILEYNKAGCKVLSGLTKRRKEESEIFTENFNTARPVLKSGARGEWVYTLQDALRGKGYIIKVDGIFGNATTEAVKDFQAYNNLKIDGIVGKDTWNCLL